MDITAVILGYLFSALIGAIVLWVLIEKLGWSYLEKHEVPAKEPGLLTLPMGIVERLLFTTAFLVGTPSIIGFWVALKVAVQWDRWSTKRQRGTYNLFLIGTALSILFGYLGACIAAGTFITFNA